MNNATTVTKKVTRATFKSFLKANAGKIWVSVRDAHNREITDKSWFQKATESMPERTFGIQGVWLVGGSDWFTAWEGEGYKGIKVSNCCYTFIVGVAI